MSSTTHAIGYSHSSRAKCHAPPPCKGTMMPIGTLRYGRNIATELGESVQWRHWGCVTADIFQELATIPIENIYGFEDLKSEDQDKIRLAISLRRIQPSDVPNSAKVKTSVPTTSTSGQYKRTLAQAGLEQQSHPPSKSRNEFPNVTRSTPEDTEENAGEEEVVDELYCKMTTNVVGIQYYHGLVGPGEEVILARQPQNEYDANAIQVKNISRIQVGHLPKNVAARLASLLDRRLVTVEGVINDGNLSRSKVYNISITLMIYGASDRRRELEAALRWATPGQRGFPSTSSSRPSNAQLISSTQTRPSSSMLPTKPVTAAQQKAQLLQQEALRNAAELRKMLNNLEKVDDEGRRSSLLDNLCSTDDILNLPLHENAPSIATGELTVDLLKHQLQALKWCIDRENPMLPRKEADKPVQFWQLRKRDHQEYYYNIATKTPQEAPPSLGRGALCADAMGLGKTLTMISLIISTKKEVDPGFSGSTLIVAPLSVLSNWEKQIAEHCTRGTISWCVYYGPSRELSVAELQKHDVVITTYQTVAGEHQDNSSNTTGPSKKKRKGDKTLFEVLWKRVILDEGHTIRNPKTKIAQAVVALNASRRWVLTGTPIINSPKDLGSLLSFLRICRPLDNEDLYKRLLLRPLKNGDPVGVELLKALMSHICIRRTKEMQDSTGKPIIELPPVEMIKVPVALSEEARDLYEQVEQTSRQRLENIMGEGTATMVQSNVLSMLTRMRQIALHPGLVPANYLEELRSAEIGDDSHSKQVAITPQQKIVLQGLLAQAIEDCQECPICFNALPGDARITSCSHIFCLACITEILSRDPKCPLDRRNLSDADLHSPLPPTDLTQRPSREQEDSESLGLRAGSSAKIDQLVHLLKLNPPTEKSLVFSQFTSFLDKIAESLDKAGIAFVRFDGKMSAKKRQEAIARFSVPLTEDELVPTQTQRKARNRTVSVSKDLNDNFDDDDSDFVMDPDDANGLFPRKRSNNKGKGRARDEDFEAMGGNNPKVMLLSLKAGALGLNLTVANNVYLMDPWWQEGIESQAVDRVNRIGQKKPVHVYQLIAENTVESKVLEIQEKKKQLIEQAFSGIKRTETQREQREARIQDLVQLFGIRSQPNGA